VYVLEAEDKVDCALVPDELADEAELPETEYSEVLLVTTVLDDEDNPVIGEFDVAALLALDPVPVGPADVELPEAEEGMLLIVSVLEDDEDNPVIGELDVAALLALDSIQVGLPDEESLTCLVTGSGYVVVGKAE